MLENAKQVKQALDDADTAQALATEAIEVAKNHINLADSDLKQVCVNVFYNNIISANIETIISFHPLQIDGQTGEAQAKAIETADKVAQLNGQLSALQKTFQRNDIDAGVIKHEADEVRDATNTAHELAAQLLERYSQANSSLTDKAATSEAARQRARQLLARASKIAGVTGTKLKELEDMMAVHRSNSDDLDALKGRLDGLNAQMTEYLSVIQTHADRYRQCTG